MHIPKAIEQGHDSQNSTKEDNKQYNDTDTQY
jgi:hypothetical protein